MGLKARRDGVGIRTRTTGVVEADDGDDFPHNKDRVFLSRETDHGARVCPVDLRI